MRGDPRSVFRVVTRFAEHIRSIGRDEKHLGVAEVSERNEVGV
jgi:hypothetical protein